MEVLPNQGEFEEAKALHPTLKGKLMNPFTETRARILASQEGFIVLEAVMKLGRPLVCLKCGDSSVAPLKLPTPLLENILPI